MHLFSITLFVSALGLFWIQPLFSRMILPQFGGSPAVWTTAVLFFQLALLLGYTYAHMLASRWPLKRQLVVHLAILALGMVVLPVWPNEALNPLSAVEWAPARLVGLMTVSIGLPFVAVSATAPCLQRWFSMTTHRYAPDPYFLYAISNAGSIVALLSYPIIIEPLFGLVRQSGLWSGIYLTLVILVVFCAIWVRRHLDGAQTSEREIPQTRLAAPQRIRWLVLSAIPSALLHASTLHITTDIASAPWIWVLPLTLYLLTFVIVFARRVIVSEATVVRILVPTTVILSIVVVKIPVFWFHNLAIALATFFVLALASHQRLAAARPTTDRLTEYYVMMALGGALGGIAATVIAPLVLDRQLEYPVLIAATLLILPSTTKVWRDGLWMIAVGLIFATAWPVAASIDSKLIATPILVVMITTLLIGVLLKNHPRRLVGLLVGSLVGMHLVAQGRVVDTRRSFFGIYEVREANNNDERLRILKHGTTVHGRQLVSSDNSTEPLSYYHRNGPLGDVMQALKDDRTDRHHVLVGLGAGAALCYARPLQRWTAIEIDQAVVDIALDTALFTYVEQCAPNSEIVVGDGRVALRSLAPNSVDVLLIDAFSSDAIPMHLLTLEAFASYIEKLRWTGLLLIHISNRVVDLEPIIGKLATELNVTAKVAEHVPASADRYADVSVWVLLARKQEFFDSLHLSLNWRDLSFSSTDPTWTDDYSNMLPYLRWRHEN